MAATSPCLPLEVSPAKPKRSGRDFEFIRRSPPRGISPEISSDRPPRRRGRPRSRRTGPTGDTSFLTSPRVVPFSFPTVDSHRRSTRGERRKPDEWKFERRPPAIRVASTSFAFPRRAHGVDSTRARFLVANPRLLRREPSPDITRRSSHHPSVRPRARWLFRFDPFTSFCPLTTGRIGFPYFLYSGTSREYRRLLFKPRFQTSQLEWNGSFVSAEIQDFELRRERIEPLEHLVINLSIDPHRASYLHELPRNQFPRSGINLNCS